MEWTTLAIVLLGIFSFILSLFILRYITKARKEINKYKIESNYWKKEHSIKLETTNALIVEHIKTHNKPKRKKNGK